MQQFDVVIVGAGPAGLTSAILLARAGKNVVVFERGLYPGAKNMFGGVLYTHSLNEVIPSFWDEAPFERYATKKRFSFLDNESSVSIEIKNDRFKEPPYNGLIVKRTHFDRWYAGKAEQAGALLVTKTQVDDLLWNNGKICGVKARGAGGDIYARVVIAADGSNSLLAEKARLRKEFKPENIYLGVREIIELPPGETEKRFAIADNEGIEAFFMGSCTNNLPGAGFIYTNKDSLSVGLVVQLDALKKNGDKPYELLEKFEKHPHIEPLLRDGTFKEYSAHTIQEGGIEGITRFASDNFLVIGEAAGLVLNSGIHLEGANLAVGSGILAAQVIEEAFKRNDLGKEALMDYERRLKASYIVKNMENFKKANRFISSDRMYSIYTPMICELAENLLTVKGEPKKKMWKLLRDISKEKGSALKTIKDLINMGLSV